MAPPTRLLVEEEVCMLILRQKHGARQSMMASTCRHHFPTQRLSLNVVASLVLTLTLTISYGTGSAVQLTGEVGGNVTFPCHVNHQRPIDLFYLQRGEEFINGYYASKDELPHTWPNTKLNLTGLSVFMYNLNLSHSGEYSCHIRYKDHSEIADTTITLSITAKYSKPTVTSPVCVEKDNLQSCHVTCSSYNGYPKAQMIVRAVGNTSNQMWETMSNKEVQDLSTMLFNSSRTVYFNCSSGEIKFSCSVGNVTSDEFTVCARQEQYNTAVIGAVVCIVVVVIGIAVVLWWRRRAGDNGRRARVPINDEVETVTIKEAA